MDDPGFSSAKADEVIRAALPQIAGALDHAHRNRIIHGDVKPSNIMIGRDARAAYLVDFGIAEAMHGQKTVGKSIGATIEYASPEQIADLPLDGRSDQFALACIAYELICGVRPFADTDEALSVVRRIRGSFTRPGKLDTRYTPALDTVFERAFTRQPNARYESCVEFFTHLIAAVDLMPDWIERYGRVAKPAAVEDPSETVAVAGEPRMCATNSPEAEVKRLKIIQPFTIHLRRRLKVRYRAFRERRKLRSRSLH
jgi:serine/threonine protein kinase